MTPPPSLDALRMVGLDHRSADLAVRSRAALVGDAAARVRAALPGSVVLSTCGRTEVYVSGVPAERVLSVWGDFGAWTTERTGDALARHLFRVVSGMESATLGEAEIVAQVRAAHREARPPAALDLLFRRAFEASKRVRTEAGLGRGGASVGSLAVREAAALHGRLDRAEILVLGAGEIAERVAAGLRARNARRVRVLNRTPARARALAETNGFDWGGLADLEHELRRADVVFAAATAPEPLVNLGRLGRALMGRAGRGMILLDLGVPPNVAPDLPPLGQRSLDLDALAARDADRTDAALPRAETIVEEEVARLLIEIARRTRAGCPA